MEPENPSPLPKITPTGSTPETLFTTDATPALPHGLSWVFLGSQGLRAGWSVLLFVLLGILFGAAIQYVAVHLHLANQKHEFTAFSAFFEELVAFVAVVAAASIVAFIEGRNSLLDFNLTGQRRILHFLSGLAAGFAALSALVGAMTWGGWLHFEPIALSGAEIFQFGALWAAAFLLVGCVEEGIFRCYLQFTLTRGINFWWALGVIALVCLRLAHKGSGNCAWGVYAIALLGLFPCLILHLRKTPRSWLLAGCLGHLDNLWLYPHRQQRRKLDRHFYRSVHRLRFLRQRAGHRFSLVGHRLPRRLGLGRDLLLRHRRQRFTASGPLPDHQPHRQRVVEWRRRMAPRAVCSCWESFYCCSWRCLCCTAAESQPYRSNCPRSKRLL